MFIPARFAALSATLSRKDVVLCSSNEKMVFKWREEHTPRFLELFRNYPSLWNYKLEGYKNREVRANAIKSLIEDLNIVGVNEEDIKLKIKTIRTRYTCELSKIKRSMKSGCSTDDVYVPKLFWFKQADEFLNAVCVPRESSSNVESHNTVEYEANTSVDDEKSHNIEKAESHGGSSFRISKNVPKNKFKKSKAREVDKIKKSTDRAYEFLNEMNQKLDPDECSLYCDLLCKKLRRLKENTRDIAMLEIDKLVYDLKQQDNQ